MNLILLGKLILIAYICVCYFNIIEIIFKGTNSVTIQILEFETPENKEDVGVCSIPTPGTKNNIVNLPATRNKIVKLLINLGGFLLYSHYVLTNKS